MNNKLKKSILFRSVKMLDIALLGIYFFTFGLISSIIMSYFTPKYDEKVYMKKSSIAITFEIYTTIAFFMILVYIIRKIVKKIPYPFDGVAGFKHERVRELKGAVILSLTLFALHSGFKEKVKILGEKIKDKF